jgi:hypothetical protein
VLTHSISQRRSGNDGSIGQLKWKKRRNKGLVFGSSIW